MTLGQKLRAAREKAGLTQSQAAEGCITRNMLSQLENDLARPSMKTLEHLSARLGVTVGWLVSDAAADSVAERLPNARARLGAGDYAACLAALDAADCGAPTAEERLLLARASAALGQQALAREDYPEAERLARQALAWNEGGLYYERATALAALAVLARCAQHGGDAAEAVAAYRQCYLQAQEAVEYHLLMARFHLEQEHVQAAEREIWSIAELPDARRAEYLILRGRIAQKKEQLENARLYLQEAESLAPETALLRRELYRAAELCAREQEDYQTAYLYATKQRELNEKFPG